MGSWVGGLRRAVLSAAVLAVAVSGVRAEVASPEVGASDWVRTPHSEVRLVAAAVATGEAESASLALQFRLKPGWKIYWRSPGDAGYPPRVEWGGSDNLADAVIAWPAPRRFEVLGLQSMGYKDEVALPVTARLRVAGAPLRLRAAVSYLACSDICVPYDAALALDLPAGPAAPSEFTHLINRFAARVPGLVSGSGLSIGEVDLTGRAGEPELRIMVRSDLPLTTPELFVEGPEDFWFGPPRVRLSDRDRVAELRVPVSVKAERLNALIGTDVTLTLVDEGNGVGLRALEAITPVARGPIEVSSLSTLAGILALALLGGLILNLMPCVLPVLSIKLMGVLHMGGAERSHIRHSFLATVAGILFSFLVLAAAAVGLKEAGILVGWGIQFQQPLFLIAMIVIVTLFAGSMWGLFDVHLPHRLADAAARVGKAGSSRSLRGSFLTGAFATLLATPCSAPFLGTAIGFALARGAPEIFAIFLALGLGLSVPYLVVVIWPGMAMRLPRPGPWMVKLRAGLGVALAVTALWLLTVLAAQSGQAATYAVAALMVAVVAVLWGRRHVGAQARRAAPVAVAVLSIAAFLAPVLAGAPAPRTARTVVAERIAWQPFDGTAIATLVADGKTVFIDVTADWCITCQVNKALVIERGPVAALLQRPDVVAMRADWTLPNDQISRYLAGFGRYGIPFNAVYGPGARGGIPLPELLTESVVLKAFEAASMAAR